MAFLAFIVSLLAIIGYLYAASSLNYTSVYISMAIHSAITFTFLTTGIFLSRHRYGFAGVIMRKNAGGAIVRKLLPFGITVPILVGLLIVEGQRFKLFDPEVDFALGIILIISIFALLMWLTAKSLNKSDDERKKAELQLIYAKDDHAANEIIYRNLIENSGVVMYTISLNGLITFTSSKAFQLTGYSMKELIGMHFSELTDAAWLGTVKEKYKWQVKNNIQETLIEFYMRTKYGDKKWVEQSAVLIIEDNLPVGFQCIVKDISERKEMEEVLRKYEVELVQNQERLQSILDNATSLMYIKDLDGKYLLTNKQFKETLNLNDTIVIGKTDFELTDSRRAQHFKDTDDEVIRSCKPVELEETLEMDDGTHNILIVKFPLLDAQNNIYGISGIGTDITERVRYQEELIEAKKIAEDAKKLQEQFLANMSHEIRTPMNGIQGMTDLLLETQLTDEQNDFATTIKRSSDNLLVIVNDILDFSKIQAGKLTIEKIDFKLSEVVENIKAIFRHHLHQKGLTLELIVDEAVPATLNGDPYRLNQILVNLVGNAIKFTHKGGIHISISIQKTAAKEIFLNFAIADTGIGIETDKIDKIFESFTQANAETSRKYGGTGLGLAITKQLLELQRGVISVTSNINSGTTFQFSIPYNYSKTNNSSFITGKDVKNYRSLFNGKKFLIAEDNEINQKVIRQVLQKAGGTVDIANNGLEAVSFLKQSNDYDLIIMDLQMPEMDGYEATKYIRNVMNLSIPIIAMTASALKGEKSKCIAIGMNDYLSKPFDFYFLYKRISLLLGEIPVSEPVVAIIEKSGNENLFDLSLLEEMNDNEYLLEMLTIFLSNTPIELNELNRACLASQFDAVYKMAHKLKGSTGVFQANFLSDVLEKIENTARAGKNDGLPMLVGLANEEYKKIEIPLKEHLKKIQARLRVVV
jgi:PAS domain S-box-containing protein